MKPSEAKKLIDDLNGAGIRNEEIAKYLHVSELYLSRLSKDSYWEDHEIPKKTSKLLKEFYDNYSPEVHIRSIAEAIDNLVDGDEFYLHSTRAIIEFENPLIRANIIEAAYRGVKISYIFPNMEAIFENYKNSSLFLSELIPSDLRNKYKFLSEIFIKESKEISIKHYDSIRKNIFFFETCSEFLFSPWTKIAIYKKGETASYTIFQENFNLDETSCIPLSRHMWSFSQKKAAIIANMIINANKKPIIW